MRRSGTSAVTICDGDLSVDLTDRLLAADLIAVDTETSGLDWSADDLQLCQLYTVETGAILVRSGEGVPQRLVRILQSDRTAKVFHFAPFDLRFLRAAWGVTARNVRCTKTAHKLLQPGAPASEHSLSALTERYLGVQLGKGAVRTSDWGAPHLSGEQVEYAAQDVIHLIPLLQRLESDLASIGKDVLFNEVCRYLPTGVVLEVDGYPDPFAY